MSQSDHQALAVGNHRVDGNVEGHHEQPPTLQNPPSQEESDVGDSSRPLFSMYSKIAEEEDNKMTDRWQQEATDGVLVFSGVFSAAVAALLAVSIQDLRPNSQDISAFYLANIYQIFADQTGTAPRSSIPSTAAIPVLFSPPRYAVWVNSLWLLSFVISLTCALLAMSLRQWASRYIRLTQPSRCTPEKRARTRAFFSDGVDNMHVPWVVEAMPALLHISLFLFFLGLVIFLLNINHSVFFTVVPCIVLFSAVYVCITFMPIFRPNCPYYTPLSTPLSLLPFSILKLTMGIVKIATFRCVWIAVAFYATIYYCFTCSWIVVCSWTRLIDRFRLGDTDSSDSMRTRLVHHGWETWHLFLRLSCRLKERFDDTYTCFDTLYWAFRRWSGRNAAKEIILKRLPEIDLGILGWTVGTLGEDDALQKFFDAIPGFFNSTLVNLPEVDHGSPNHWRLYYELGVALNGFLRRTLSSNSVLDSVKNRRLDIYLNANNVIFGPRRVSHSLYQILSGNFGQFPQTIETASAMAHWCASNREHVALAARCMVASILQTPLKRDDCWIALARDQLGLPDHVLRDSISRGDDSVCLAIFIHMTRQFFRTKSWNLTVLSSLSKFDICNTHPGLQNAFCSLWNEIVLQARKQGSYSDPAHILREIRRFYVALHQGTDAAPTTFDASTRSLDRILDRLSSYPLCNIATHHPDSTLPPPAQIDDPNDASPYDASPRSSRLEIQSIPRGNTNTSTAPQQAAEANMVAELPSSDFAAAPSEGFPSPSSTTGPIHIPPRITSVTDTSIRESLQTVALDLTRLGSMMVADVSRPSSLLTVGITANITANLVRLNEPTADIPIGEMGESSQNPTATPLNLPLLDLVPVTIIPATIPHPHSASAQQPESNKKQDIVAPSTASDILSRANQATRAIPPIDFTLRTSQESTCVPPTTGPGSLPSPIMMPAFRSSVIPVEHPSSLESVFLQPCHLLGSLSSSLTTIPSSSTLVTSVLDAGIATSTGVSSAHEYDENPVNPYIPKEVSLHAPRSGPSSRDVAEDALLPGVSQNDQN